MGTGAGRALPRRETRTQMSNTIRPSIRIFRRRGFMEPSRARSRYEKIGRKKNRTGRKKYDGTKVIKTRRGKKFANPEVTVARGRNPPESNPAYRHCGVA